MKSVCIDIGLYLRRDFKSLFTVLPVLESLVLSNNFRTLCCGFRFLDKMMVTAYSFGIDNFLFILRMDRFCGLLTCDVSFLDRGA